MVMMARLVVKKVSLEIFEKTSYGIGLMMGIAIESRVARIKARVAELTGNMEQSGAPASPARR